MSETPPVWITWIIATLAIGGVVCAMVGYSKLVEWWETRHQRPKRQKRENTYTSYQETTPALQTPIASPPEVLPLRSWLHRVNHEPNRCPHLIVNGPTGSGKTTLVLALLSDRPGKILVGTPKNRRDDPWGGLPAIRLRTQDMSFDPIAEMIEAAYREMLRRNADESGRENEWLTVVLDEAPTVYAKCKGLSDKVLDMLRLARSVRIRVILLATETTVRALGLEGNGDARENCVFVQLDEHRNATIYRWGKTPEPINTAGVYQLAGRPIPRARWWQQMATMPALVPRHREMLSSLLDDDLPTFLVTNGVTNGNDGNETVTAYTSTVTADVAVTVTSLEAAKIAHLLATLPPSEVVKKLDGYSPRRYAEFKTKVDQVRAMLEP